MTTINTLDSDVEFYYNPYANNLVIINKKEKLGEVYGITEFTIQSKPIYLYWEEL